MVGILFQHQTQDVIQLGGVPALDYQQQVRQMSLLDFLGFQVVAFGDFLKGGGLQHDHSQSVYVRGRSSVFLGLSPLQLLEEFRGEVDVLLLGLAVQHLLIGAVEELEQVLRIDVLQLPVVVYHENRRVEVS